VSGRVDERLNIFKKCIGWKKLGIPFEKIETGVGH